MSQHRTSLGLHGVIHSSGAIKVSGVLIYQIAYLFVFLSAFWLVDNDAYCAMIDALGSNNRKLAQRF